MSSRRRDRLPYNLAAMARLVVVGFVVTTCTTRIEEHGRVADADTLTGSTEAEVDEVHVASEVTSEADSAAPEAETRADIGPEIEAEIDDPQPECGDGVVGPAETCDPPESCPLDCDDQDACTRDVLEGVASQCTASCVHQPITSCAAGDGCCPAGCDTTSDGDCTPTCGNGVVELGETCDPPGACPSACDDDNACTADRLLGNPSSCDAACAHEVILSCQGDDGCCPDGCNALGDNDCPAVCGNGIVEPTETCDPPESCPTSCPPSTACLTRVFTGDPERCTAVCIGELTLSCRNGDACCPDACSEIDDADCGSACGNGVVEPSETCDPPESCPSCDDGDPCTTDRVFGEADSCDVVCVSAPVTVCTGRYGQPGADSCCPEGCTAANDSDCEPRCGNSVVEFGETCDPPESCGRCDDGDACTIDEATGSAADCDLTCTHRPKTACIDSDGCCPSGCDQSSDSDCQPSCGNGVIESGETCDPPATCPNTCNDGDPCTIDSQNGSRASCTLTCTHTPKTCGPFDGCCPGSCHANADSDCRAVCGNGVVESGETCDPPGTCPSSCGDANACTIDTLLGSAASCTATCSHTATGCENGDGCCASGCNSLNDNDCAASCGNGVVEAGETCDPPGTCPASCDDGVPCTTDIVTGSAASCTAACSSSPTTACVGGDACCPGGCGVQSDSDCAGGCDGTCVSGDGCCPAGCDIASDDDCPLDPLNDSTWPDAWRGFEDEVVALINQHRTSGAVCGNVTFPAVPALASDPLLRMAARKHSLDMAVSDFVSHVGSDGSDPEDRVMATGYDGYGVGENVAGGLLSPAEVVDRWIRSTAHCENLMYDGYTETGVGFVEWPGSTYTRYWTQDFATGN